MIFLSTGPERRPVLLCGSLVRRVPSAGQQCMLRQAARSVTYTVSHLVYASSAADSILIAGDTWYTDSKGDTWWLTRWKIEVEVPTRCRDDPLSQTLIRPKHDT